jgi:uncharacterized protein with PQ loop repeat
MSTSPTELVGYAASLFVLVSFLMKDIRTLRMVNSVGCALFVVYGIMLEYSIPIVLTNAAILVINGRALMKK